MTKQDWLEAVIYASIATLLTGPIVGVLILAAWLLAARYLRAEGLDSDYEHVNHRRHDGH